VAGKKTELVHQIHDDPLVDHLVKGNLLWIALSIANAVRPFVTVVNHVDAIKTTNDLIPRPSM
jgi:hypothetical protein